jgi:hypothetical protein
MTDPSPGKVDDSLDTNDHVELKPYEKKSHEVW